MLHCDVMDSHSTICPTSHPFLQHTFDICMPAWFPSLLLLYFQRIRRDGVLSVLFCDFISHDLGRFFALSSIFFRLFFNPSSTPEHDYSYFFFPPPVHSFLDISLLSSHPCNTYQDGRMVGRNSKSSPQIAMDEMGTRDSRLILLILYLPVAFLTLWFPFFSPISGFLRETSLKRAFPYSQAFLLAIFSSFFGLIGLLARAVR